MSKISPILFSTPMVQAILERKKTQTRRVINPQPTVCQGRNLANPCGCSDWESVHTTGTICCKKCGEPYRYSYENNDAVKLLRPTYRTGDILWVRETWRMYEKAVGKGENFHVEWFFAYKADTDNPEVPKCSEWYDNIKPLGNGLHQEYKTGSWRPSIFMPKEAARIFLRVTDARVERLQQITYGDCCAEGVFEISELKSCAHGSIATEKYHELWDSLNAKRDGGKYAWSMNPWVWVYKFECCEKPNDFPQ